MRGKVLHLLFTCGFTLAGTLASGAQTNATPEVSSVVSCLVTDNSEAVIANAEVIFESNAGVVRTHTDQTGSVKIKLKSGTYNVTVRSLGFKTAQVISLLVEAPTPKALNIRLVVGTRCDDCSSMIGGVVPVPVDTADLPSKFLPQRLPPAEKHRMRTFAGTWETKIDPPKRSNVVLNLKPDGNSLTGTVEYVNPDHTKTMVKISFVFLENNALEFQTDDGSLWHLVPSRRLNFATLWNGTHKLSIEKTVKSK